MIIYFISGFSTILKVFINYKRFVFAAALFSSLFKSRIVIVFALRNAAAFFSIFIAFFPFTVNIAFTAFIAQLSFLYIAFTVIASFYIGFFLSFSPLPFNTFIAVIYFLYSRFNSFKPIFTFTQKSFIFRNLTYNIGQVLAVISFYYIARRPFRALVIFYFIVILLRVYRVNPSAGYL